LTTHGHFHLLDGTRSLRAECERFLQQAAYAPQRRDLTQSIRTFQAQLDAAVAAEDFDTVVAVGSKLKALKAQSAQVPLSEQDYLTLPARYAELLREVTGKCLELTAAQQYAELAIFGPLQKALKALDMAVIAHGSTADSTAPLAGQWTAAEQDESAYDPVLPSDVFF
jgi:hypothetical protein